MVERRPSRPRNPGRAFVAHDGGQRCGANRGRLHLLLSSGDWQEETWADLLPRLLEPMGVEAVRVRSGSEATRVIRTTPIDIAVVDLALPLADGEGERGDAGGRRLLEVLARLPSPPPTVIVKRRTSRREEAREIAAALQARAFAVIERPVHLEIVLDTMRRILTKYHGGCWPSGLEPGSPPAADTTS